MSLNFTGPTRTPTPTPTRTSSLTSAEDPRAAVGLPRRTRPVQLADLSADFSRGCPLGMRACTRVRILYTMNYRVGYTFTKLHDRRIPKVRVGVGVGVGPMEFKLW